MTSTISPERIRSLRGPRSRAMFARLLEVTPHTVYRWELPDDATEARRPRGVELAKLERLANGQTPSSVPPPAPADAAKLEPLLRVSQEEDVTAVLPALERVLNGEIKKGHAELVALIAARHDFSADARALARFGIALFELTQRADPRAALLVISPSMSDAEGGLLAGAVAARVFAAAALLHALPDASLFDLGRVHAYSARTEGLAWRGDRDAACIAYLANLSAATLVGDKDLLERAFAKLDDAHFADLPSLLEAHVEEFRALRQHLSGKTAASLRATEILAERAEQHGYHALHARTLSCVALRMLESLTPPESILPLTRRAKQIGRNNRIAPGMHAVFAIRAEMETLLRLGRTQEALALIAELEAWSAETGMPPLPAVSAAARLLFLTGRHQDLAVLTARLRNVELSAIRPIASAYAAHVEAAACLASSEDVLATVAAFERAEQEATRWPLLLRDVLIHRVIAHVVAGQDGAARVALRRVHRFADGLPSAYLTAHLRRLEGMMLVARGQWAEGRQLLESAIATFELASDVCDATMCRHFVATFAVEYGEPGAQAGLDEARSALERIGLAQARALKVGLELLRASRSLKSSPASSEQRLGTAALVVPMQRLAVRGAAPGLILRELMSVVSTLFPERKLRLEELDSTGNARLIAGASEGEGDGGYEWLEFSDGAGRLLRLGMQGELGEGERASLAILTTTTSLALEAATLRGVNDPGDVPAGEDRVPELPGFVAASPEMRRLRQELVRLSGSRATVIITGESGSGKEVVARAIHDLSERSGESYIPFNCATVPRDLFEGQLFGYRRGAFTGASSDHPGVIRAADKGTLFLDEIGELPLDIQPKLLRFLENSEIFPLGERRPLRVDVRVIAATHRDLGELVKEGLFREDLYYRLQVVPIFVPPLRSRREDIPVLARYFVRELSRGREPPVIAPDALVALMAHPFRGNVRELRNVIERALAFSPPPDVLRAEHLRLT